MGNVSLYLATVFIWGSTWLAIKYQLGVVAPEVSIAYRFALAAALLIAWCLGRGLSLRFSLREHAWMALQGTLLFSLNYLLVYEATAFLTTGLVAVAFSTMVVMNIVNGALFFRLPVQPQVVVGAIIGLLGISLVFWPEVSDFGSSQKAFLGLGLALAGTLLASLGTMVSTQNQRNGLPVVQSNAIGMSYGALLMLVVASLSGQPLDFEVTAAYIGSLLYLSLFGSVLAFGCYLTLLGRIGPSRAAYAMVLFPVVALAISTVAEDFRWSAAAAGGALLVLAGNLLVLAGPALIRARRPAPDSV
ncbi:MAG: EamA family transporter [Gammaproteobacteria bacterium]|nr:MAG: EamA family transporter [Gammaproteobacteria bacterium]